MLLNKKGIKQLIKGKKLSIPLSCLIFGTDQGGILLTLNEILSYVHPKDVCHLSYGLFQELESEIHNNNIFNQHKIIVIKNVPANPKRELIKIIDDKNKHSLIMVSAELKKNSFLRTKFENSDFYIAINCYFEQEKERIKTIKDALESLSLSYEPGLPILIAQVVDRDSLVLQKELEKISLYYNKKKESFNKVENNVVLSLLSIDYNIQIYDIASAICNPATQLCDLNELLRKAALMKLNYNTIVRVTQKYILYILKAKKYCSNLWSTTY